MTTLIAALVLMAIPFVAVSAVLTVVERLQNRRDSERDRQIMLTDAIKRSINTIAVKISITIGKSCDRRNILSV